MRDAKRDRLLELIREKSFLQGDVTLSSGQVSDFYIDGKMVELHPEGAYLIGEVLCDLIEAMDIDAIGGLAVGAVPMVASVVVSCHHHGLDVEGFFVRDTVKSHGTRKTIEGNLPKNAKVVIVDDVVTSGKSVMKAVDAVKEHGCHIEAVISIVDRDAGAKEFFEDKGLRYVPVFSKNEVMENAQPT